MAANPIPLPLPPLPPLPSLPPNESLFDPREAGRVVATVLLAAPVNAGLVDFANRELVRLGLLALSERDNVLSTPEELAPLIPPRLRDALADLLLNIAANEPMRRRVALSYVHIWNQDRHNHGSRNDATARNDLDVSLSVSHQTPPPPPPGVAERAIRAVVGPLPSHQTAGDIPTEQSPITQMQQPAPANGYRERQQPVLAPVVDPLRARVARVRAEMQTVITAVDRVVIGKHEIVTKVLMAMAARGHVLLMDVPGVGKTLLCKTIAAALGSKFGRVQLTPDLMPMDVTGATTYDAQAGRFTFRPGPIFTNILLADEINRATPKTQSALLEVMEERTVTVDGTTHRMADPFQVLATMNPFDHEGTYQLPAAQIDRFMVMLELGFPTIADEVRVLDAHLAETHLESLIQPVITTEAFIEWQKTIPMIHASPDLKLAAVRYVDGLRKTVQNGHAVSPRTTIAWVRVAQARAILAGREFVTIEDLLDVAPEVFRHRLWIPAVEIRERLHALVAAAAR